MGIYLNPRNHGFLNAIRLEVYVDKTGLIAHTNKYINTEQRFICVSRPRRFGKSMTLKMLAAYYSIRASSSATRNKDLKCVQFKFGTHAFQISSSGNSK